MENTIYHQSKGKWSANGLHIMIEGKQGSQGQAYIQHTRLYGDANFKDVEALANAKLWAASKVLLQACVNALRDIKSINRQMENGEFHPWSLTEQELESVIRQAVYVDENELKEV